MRRCRRSRWTAWCGAWRPSSTLRRTRPAAAPAPWRARQGGGRSGRLLAEDLPDHGNDVVLGVDQAGDGRLDGFRIRVIRPVRAHLAVQGVERGTDRVEGA